MPYVRKHGKQVAIVHGERDATGAVQQQVLFSLYSKPEAEAALGERPTDPPLSFRGLMESRHEGIRFDWRKLDPAIAALKDELPPGWNYPTSGVAPELRQAVVGLTRALFTANPQTVSSAKQALADQRASLSFVRELIDARLKVLDHVQESPWSRDNEFGWLARLAGRGVPPEAEEWLEGFQERGEVERAEALAHVMVEAWPEYADGYNMLGLLALERGEHERALAWFARTMEVGRTLFPKRIAKSRWWTDHDTRPYMRGMRNTTVTLARMGRDEEVLAWCERLDSECFDDLVADGHRAAACLNLGCWTEAKRAAARLSGVWPHEDFLAAFACFELGEREEALARWLHGAISGPRAARILTGGRSGSRVTDHDAAKDHNAGIERRMSLGRYLQRKPAQRFFAAITAAPEVVALVTERAAAVAAWHADRGPDRTAYDRMQEMATLEFARKEAARLGHLARG